MTTGGSADPQPDLDLDDLKQAELRLTRTVDALRGDDWAAPSLLPDWTRAHVVAHLALNGEALRDVLRGEVDHDRVPTPTSPSSPRPSPRSSGNACWAP
jgi:maleylpyruvate isomerase